MKESQESFPISRPTAQDAAETLNQAMFDCQKNQTAGAVLLNGLRKVIPNLTSSQFVTLNINPSEEQSFPLVWTIAHFLSPLWQENS
jgi:hypothetical protein